MACGRARRDRRAPLLVAPSVAEAIVDRNVTDFNDTGWIYPFFVGVLASYGIGGWVAGRTAPDSALTNGAVAGSRWVSGHASNSRLLL